MNAFAGTHKAVFLLKYFLDGNILEYDNRLWAMADDHRLGCLALNMEKTTEEKLVPEEHEGSYKVICLLSNQLEDFINWAQNIPDDVLFIAGANVVLQEINSSRWKGKLTSV